ncbi:hypothetical protein [Pelobium manganitolerans]|uniref:hypothetical protein n=1 Tax=Pelobium manganitolerans TaxID=1842495 RepID=UPI003FA3A351
MKDFDSLVGIWNEQKTAPKVDYKEVIFAYKRGRNKLSAKLLREALLMLLALGAVAYVAASVDFDFWTSYLGLGLVALCCAYFVVMQFINMRKIANSNTLFDKPADHIRFLKAFKQSRHVQHTRNYKLYTLFVGLGALLYFVELFYKMGPLTMGIILIATAAWFALSYFYFLKQYIQQEEAKLQEMLADLERLNQQFSADEL